MSDWADGDLYDRIDELRAENATLRATIEARDDALMRAGRDNLRLGRIVERVQELADTYGYTPNGTSAHHEIADQITRAIDGAPDPRRVETAEELDALPDRTVIRDADEWVFEKLNYRNDGTGESFWAAPAIDPDSDDYSIVPDLPATVLWLPEVSL